MQFDHFIQASLDKWPNIPTLYGWLSLTQDGQWRLHPKTPILNAAIHIHEAGESISSPGLIRFLNSYYFEDENGAWFFQNGPQRVYVALSSAPWILHLDTANTSALITHTGKEISHIHAWYLDENGLFYAQTDKGFALIKGRDVAPLIDYLHITEQMLEDVLASTSGISSLHASPIEVKKVHHPIYGDAPLSLLLSLDREKVGGFIAYPNHLPMDTL